MKRFYNIHFFGAPKGESGEILGMKFDLSPACKTCGTGAELSGNLTTNGIDKAKQNFFTTKDGDFIISEQLNNELINRNIKPELLQVTNKAGQKLPFYHLDSNFTLPKILPESKGIQVEVESQCQICKRDGHFGILIMHENRPSVWQPTEYIFDIDDKTMLESYDVFKTWEYFGMSVLKSKKPQFGRPEIIVSEGIKKVFEEQKIKNVLFEELKFK